MSALVVCSHGTRSRAGALRVSRLVSAVAGALPAVDVREAHVDVHPPYLDDVVTPGAVVVPFLLGPGYHVRVDIGQSAARFGAHVSPTLGPDPAITALLVARLGALEQPLGVTDLVVLAAAGSSMAGSDTTTRAVARDLGRAIGRPVAVGYGASCEPLVGDLVARLRAEHPGRRVVAASYLLAPGHFQDRLAAAGFDDVTAPLLQDEAPEPLIVDLVVRRYLGAALAEAG